MTGTGPAWENTETIMAGVRKRLPNQSTHDYNRTFEAVLEWMQGKYNLALALPSQGQGGTEWARYEVAHDETGKPEWVVRIHHGPYVSYHYTKESAETLCDILNTSPQACASEDAKIVEWMDKHWHDWQKWVTTDSDGWAYRSGKDSWHEANNFRSAVLTAMQSPADAPKEGEQQPVPISERAPEFPCWLWNRYSRLWRRATKLNYCASNTHWLPDALTKPTVTPKGGGK